MSRWLNGTSKDTVILSGAKDLITLWTKRLHRGELMSCVRDKVLRAAQDDSTASAHSHHFTPFTHSSFSNVSLRLGTPPRWRLKRSSDWLRPSGKRGGAQIEQAHTAGPAEGVQAGVQQHHRAQGVVGQRAGGVEVIEHVGAHLNGHRQGRPLPRRVAHREQETPGAATPETAPAAAPATWTAAGPSPGGSGAETRRPAAAAAAAPARSAGRAARTCAAAAAPRGAGGLA